MPSDKPFQRHWYHTTRSVSRTIKPCFVMILNVETFETSTRNYNIIEPHEEYSGRRQGSLLLHPNKDNFQLQNRFIGTS